MLHFLMFQFRSAWAEGKRANKGTQHPYSGVGSNQGFARGRIEGSNQGLVDQPEDGERAPTKAMLTSQGTERGLQPRACRPARGRREGSKQGLVNQPGDGERAPSKGLSTSQRTVKGLQARAC